MLEEHAATRSTVQLSACWRHTRCRTWCRRPAQADVLPEAFASASVLRPPSCRRMGAGDLRVDEGAAGAPLCRRHAATRSTERSSAMLATYVMSGVVPGPVLADVLPGALRPLAYCRRPSCRRKWGCRRPSADEGAASAPLCRCKYCQHRPIMPGLVGHGPEPAIPLRLTLRVRGEWHEPSLPLRHRGEWSELEVPLRIHGAWHEPGLPLRIRGEWPEPGLPLRIRSGWPEPELLLRI